MSGSKKRHEKTGTYIQHLRKRISASIQHALAMRTEIAALKSALRAVRDREMEMTPFAREQFINETLAGTKDWDVEWKTTWHRVRDEDPPERATEAALGVHEVRALEGKTMTCPSCGAGLPEPGCGCTALEMQHALITQSQS